MDGVLSIPSVFYTMNDFLGLKIKTSTNKDFETVDVHMGQGPSAMGALPSSYTPKDLKVRDSDGDLISTGKKCVFAELGNVTDLFIQLVLVDNLKQKKSLFYRGSKHKIVKPRQFRWGFFYSSRKPNFPIL